jgi:integrase
MQETTIKQAVDLYLEAINGNVTESVSINKGLFFNRYVIEFFGGDKNLTDTINTKSLIMWRTWLNTRQKRNCPSQLLAATTKNKFICYFKGFLNFLKIADLLSDVAPEILPRYKNEHAPNFVVSVWDDEEFKKFMTVIHDIQDRLIFSILYWSGIRVGELLALKWVDFYDNKLSIYKSLSENTTSYIGLRRAKVTPRNNYIIQILIGTNST